MKEVSRNSNPEAGEFNEPSFEIDGQVVELLRGCGTAVIASEYAEVMLNRGTDGVHFEQLYLGQKVICDVAKANKRVLFAHQQTSSIWALEFDAGAAPTQKIFAKGIV